MNTRLTPLRAAVAIILGACAILSSACSKSATAGTCARNVSVDNISAVEGSAAATTYRTIFEFTLTSTGCAAGGSLAYHVDLSSGTAKATTDFDNVSGTVDFKTGNMDAQPLRVPVVADVDWEPNEQFYICLKAPSIGGGLTAPSAAPAPIVVTTSYGVGTIVNDDTEPRWSPVLSAGPSPNASPPTTDELHCSR